MMDEFIHWPKPYVLLSTTCDEILSWVIEIQMKNYWVSDCNCTTITPTNLQGMTNNVGLTISVGDTTPQFIIWGASLHGRRSRGC